MKQYLDTCRMILDEGSWQDNRTGIRSISVPGVSMRFNLAKGFPAVTTKKLAFKSIVGELCGFMRAARSAADFRALGCKVWDDNANHPGKEGSPNAWLSNPWREGQDHLGDVYGAMWREWPAYKFIDARETAKCDAAVAAGYVLTDQIERSPQTGFVENVYCKTVDMLGDCVRKIIKTPTDRRILFHAWNPAKLDEMALPPCHLLYQFLPNVSTGELSMCLYIRSNDMFLGSPFNIAEGALLLELVARLTGYKAKWFTYFVGDAHIYENSLDQVKEQLTREPHHLPRLMIDESVPTYERLVLATSRLAAESTELINVRDVAAERAVEWLKKVEPYHLSLQGYEHHAAIKAEMAV
jgi:thymidylate synthase